jgi:hypothetical protein
MLGTKCSTWNTFLPAKYPFSGSKIATYASVVTLAGASNGNRVFRCKQQVPPVVLRRGSCVVVRCWFGVVLVLVRCQRPQPPRRFRSNTMKRKWLSVRSRCAKPDDREPKQHKTRYFLQVHSSVGEAGCSRFANAQNRNLPNCFGSGSNHLQSTAYAHGWLAVRDRGVARVVSLPPPSRSVQWRHDVTKRLILNGI